mgnify:CR=1 FL=1
MTGGAFVLRKPSARRALASYIDSQERVDIKVFIILLMLNIFGIIMIYSASSYRCSLSPKYNYDNIVMAYFLLLNLNNYLLNMYYVKFLITVTFYVIK